MLATQTTTLQPSAFTLHPSSFSLQPSTLSTLSLADLRATKARWLSDAEQSGNIQVVMDVAREFGRPYVIRGRKSASARLLEIPYGDEILHALYYDETGAWLPALHDYAWYKTIVVSIGRADWWQAPRCLVYSQTNHPRPNHENYLYIPGDWIAPFLLQASSAQEHLIARLQADYERQRAALLAQLTLATLNS